MDRFTEAFSLKWHQIQWVMLQRTVLLGCYNESGGILSADVARAYAWRVGPVRLDYSVSHHLCYRLYVSVTSLVQLFAYLRLWQWKYFFKLFCYIILAMSRQNRVRKLINLDIRKEIISKRESGKSVWDLSAEYGMAKSTTRTILKNKEKIESAQVAEGICRLSSSRCNITQQIKQLFIVFTKEILFMLFKFTCTAHKS